MISNKRIEIVKMFRDVASHLDVVAGQADIEHTYRHVGRVYGQTSKVWMAYYQSPDVNVDTHFTDDVFGRFKARYDNISAFANAADWGGVVRESYGILCELEGRPGWKPPVLPPPPGQG